MDNLPFYHKNGHLQQSSDFRFFLDSFSETVYFTKKEQVYCIRKMLKLSVIHSSPVWGTQTVWDGRGVNNEPSQSYDSPTQTESINEPELAGCYWSAVHTRLESMAKLELTIDLTIPWSLFVSPPYTSAETNKVGEPKQAWLKWNAACSVHFLICKRTLWKTHICHLK